MPKPKMNWPEPVVRVAGVPRGEMVKEKKSPRGLVPSSTYGRLDTSYNAYLDELDPRGESERSKQVQFALSIAKDARFREFYERLALPAYSKWSLAALAKACDISLPEFAEFWNKSQSQRALAIAQDALPAVVTDLATESVAKIEVCSRCDNFGFVYCEEISPDFPGYERLGIRTLANGKQIRTCPQCAGKGSVVKPGETDSRRMLLDMTGMGAKKAAGVAVNINNYGGMGMESAVGRLQRISFDPGDDVIDVDPEPAS